MQPKPEANNPQRESALPSATGYAPDGRPMQITLPYATLCCGSKLIIQCDGTFRCPCGRRQENAAKAVICSGVLAHNDQAEPRRN